MSAIAENTAPVSAAPEIAAPLIAGHGITLQHGSRLLLDSIDLEVAPGEIVTLIGPNGSGKTTLLRVLLGLVKPNRGAVERKPGLRIGYVPQRLQIDPTLPLTVERFLTLAGRSARGHIGELLAEVGAERTLRQQLGELSGGEFQRVLLARALVRDPQLLVLDEPVQGVDFAGQLELFQLIGRIRQRRGCGILVVSHDLHLVMSSTDRVVCLNQHLCCSGAPEAVSQHPEYLRLFGPRAAAGLAVYTHHHDHRHGPDGEVLPLKERDNAASHDCHHRDHSAEPH